MSEEQDPVAFIKQGLREEGTSSLGDWSVKGREQRTAWSETGTGHPMGHHAKGGGKGSEPRELWLPDSRRETTVERGEESSLVEIA